MCNSAKYRKKGPLVGENRLFCTYWGGVASYTPEGPRGFASLSRGGFKGGVSLVRGVRAWQTRGLFDNAVCKESV